MAFVSYARRPRSIPGLLCAALAIAPGSAQPLARPKFDVASIKPCRADLPPDARSGGNSSPELLEIDCQTVRSLIGAAYVAFATGVRVTPLKVPIEGGPAWIDSERYEIKARAEGVKNQAMMYGPLLQALLEDRFQLRIHRETREAPVYALIVLKKGAKLRPFKEGSCNPYDITASFPPPPAPENPCLTRGETKDGVLTINAIGTTLDEFASFILRGLDRPVVNRTGLKGRFDIHLEFAPDEAIDVRQAPGAAGGLSGPSIFTAVQEQLGLKLEPARGPREYLVIDRVERPLDN